MKTKLEKYIDERIWECPFCFKEIPDMNSPCCGEIGQAIEKKRKQKRQVKSIKL